MTGYNNIKGIKYPIHNALDKTTIKKMVSTIIGGYANMSRSINNQIKPGRQLPLKPLLADTLRNRSYQDLVLLFLHDPVHLFFVHLPG